jgi:hypothetical protein
MNEWRPRPFESVPTGGRKKAHHKDGIDGRTVSCYRVKKHGVRSVPTRCIQGTEPSQVKKIVHAWDSILDNDGKLKQVRIANTLERKHG